MDAKQLESIIKLKEARVAVFGLGYVGLPLAVEIAKAGFKTTGADVNTSKIELLRVGKNPLPDMKLDEMFEQLVAKNRLDFSSPEVAAAKSDIKIICVPTPSLDKYPDLTYIRSVAKYIGKYVKRGDLIINESTVGPKMTRKILCSVLEVESGLEAGKDFFVVASPERIDPGNPISLLDIPKVVGGINEESTKLATLFYSSFIKKVIPVSSVETAEMVKMLENSFRALNIGFANELAKFCDISKLDIREIISAASTKPYGFMPHNPGIGVGGHCIPEDPYYLLAAGEDIGVKFPLLSLALTTNESMPYYVLYNLMRRCEELKLKPAQTKIVIFGLSYKKNTKDMRLSPALIFHDLVQNEGFDIKVYDELFSKDELQSQSLGLFNSQLDECNVAVIGCDHTHIQNFDFTKLKNLKFIIDGKNILESKHVPVFGIGTAEAPLHHPTGLMPSVGTAEA
jgi:UDP-N-acetyl-D-glucosamine dehydrogenase